jgi:hypothetical protein
MHEIGFNGVWNPITPFDQGKLERVVSLREKATGL